MGIRPGQIWEVKGVKIIIDRLYMPYDNFWIVWYPESTGYAKRRMLEYFIINGKLIEDS